MNCIREGNDLLIASLGLVIGFNVAEFFKLINHAIPV